MLDKDLIKSSCMLMKSAMEVSNESVVDIFVDYSAHVNEITIQIHENGWVSEEAPTKKFRIDLDCEYNKKEFIESQILKALVYINSFIDS